MASSTKSERSLRVILIGAGGHATRTLLPTLHHLPFELVAICDLDEARARQAARKWGCSAHTDLARALDAEKPEAVLLAAGPGAHPPLACRALEAGVHVWMEKPSSYRARDLDPVLERRGDRVVVVGYKKAFMPATDKAIELLSAEGGKALQSALAVYPIDVPEDGRRILEEGVFTNWLGNGCHPLSLLVAVAGEVEALTVRRSRHGGGMCLLEFAGGAVGALHLAAGAPSSQAVERYHFVADGRQVVIDNGSRVHFQRGIPFRYGQTVSFAPEGLDHGAIVWEPQNHLATLENRMEFTQGFYGELRYFYDCIVEGRPAVRGSLEFARHLTLLYEAALLSEGREIHIADLG
ncbi:MAG: gfo/Idh/MocA family oxidoreductase [Puniceicoccaceae bacterium]|nr:MAG: gfo/Idh/MocA family oxidoreductase [Puniceicoccaceae bacterium]